MEAANSFTRRCSAATFSGLSAARSSFSDGSWTRLYSSGTDGSGARQMSFPVSLADRSAERLDIIDYFGPRRRSALAYGGPDIQAIQRLALGRGRAGQFGESGIHVHDVNQTLNDGAGRNVARPVGEGADARAAFIERTFALAIGSVVAWDFDFDMSPSPANMALRVPPLSL